jgi:hypothetical protein
MQPCTPVSRRIFESPTLSGLSPSREAGIGKTVFNRKNYSVEAQCSAAAYVGLHVSMGESPAQYISTREIRTNNLTLSLNGIGHCKVSAKAVTVVQRG